jgi:alcohol dehydrogenase YqhD (iron-dependent ADH family)
MSDGFCEAGLKTLMKNVRVVLEKPDDYEARANIFLACTYGCNGIYSLGIAASGWPMHAIEHALSAYYDITHGIGLAIITPRWMKHILSDKTIDRFVKFGVNVLGIDSKLSPSEIANKSIDRMYEFFESIGIPMHLREVGIDESRIGEMAHHVALQDGLDKAWAPLLEDDIAAIIKDSL